MTATTNGRIRRTLADQIDRLDNVLDGLAENLNDAVASAVKDVTGTAVQQAVRQALVEVFTNPDVLALIGGVARTHDTALQASNPMPAANGSNPNSRDRLGTLRDWASRQARTAKSVFSRVVAAGCGSLRGLAARLVPLWYFRKQVAVALGVGTTAGVIAYVAGPWVGSLLSGIAAFASALALQAGLWLRRLVSEATFAGNAS